MVYLKSSEEIMIMQEGGKRLMQVVQELLPTIKPGITTNQIDQEAEQLFRNYHIEPSFKTVQGYRWSTCLPINEQVVHTPPSERIVKDGDVLTVDIGAYYQGYHTDYATTFVVGDK